MQKPNVRKAMNLGNRSMSDGLDIYKAMIEDTMQDVIPELVEAMENYKVKRYSPLISMTIAFAGVDLSRRPGHHLSLSRRARDARQNELDQQGGLLRQRAQGSVAL